MTLLTLDKQQGSFVDEDQLEAEETGVQEVTAPSQTPPVLKRKAAKEKKGRAVKKD